MSFALGSLISSGSQDHDLNLAFPVITAITLTVGAVAWRCCFGSKQPIVPAKNALKVTTLDERSSEVKVKKTVRFAQDTKSEVDSVVEDSGYSASSQERVERTSSVEASSSQPTFDEIDCSVLGFDEYSRTKLRLPQINIKELASLEEKTKVYPKDLMPILSRFIDSNENKEQQIAQIMLRRAGQRPLYKSTRGVVPEWFYTNQSTSKESGSTVLPYLKGSEVESFVRDFIYAKGYASHPDCRL